MEAAKPRGLADDVDVHCLQQFVARCVGREIQLRILAEYTMRYAPSRTESSGPIVLFPMYAGVMHELHRKAAEYYELAAKAHRTAAEHRAYELAKEAHNKSGRVETLS